LDGLMAKPYGVDKVSISSIYPTSHAPIKTTQLNRTLENMYQAWVRENDVPESNDYDMRGFFLGLMTGDSSATSGVNPSDGTLHFSDKWKLPNHPNFSNESIYSKSVADPKWVENPSPYKEGSWARRGPYGNLNVEIPE
jgi:hypothetical protein